MAGGAFLSAFLQVAFDRLASPTVLDYFRDKKLDDKLLKKMKVLLLSINAVIDDAEDKHYSNKHVSEWLDMVKDAVLDAEDLLDEIHTEASKSKLEAEFQTATTSSKVWSYYLPASVSSFDKELQPRMKEILDNLETLASEKDILRLEKVTGVGVGVGLGENVSHRQTTSLVDEATVYGRYDDKNVIVDLLLSDNESGNNLTVISIAGMGGLGKTTLAQLVYNDIRVKDEFQLKAWVCVCGKFDDTVRVTRTILEALTLSNDDTKDLSTLQVLQDKLKERLSGKKFLLVLDDVWEENYLNWEDLQAPFVCGAKGSKILVTTRSEKVASTMRCAHLHQLKKLLEEHSWMLFAKYALRDANSTSDFEDVGRKIIKKCDGLPLALKAIGGLLYTKSSYEEWNRILTSEMWDISDDGCNIIPALRLSYQYLPSPLKRCFAYCSLIPKDYEFEKDCLVELWMAENFLQVHRQNISMKELGDQFFNDLLLRSFFQRSSTRGERFVMHDLVNDLAKYVSGEFCLRLEKEEAKNVSKMTRHISYLGNSSEGSKQFEAIFKANKLRTFLPFIRESISSKMIDDLLCECKCLRVLSLCSSFNNVYELPDTIGNLKHLRYLDLSETGVKNLPDSTCLLYNLQTLKLWNCRFLKELPSDMQKLVNLRYLDFRGTMVRKLPNGVGKLKKLEVLSSFFVGKCGESNINQLAELNLQGTLSIKELQNVADPMDALAANLKSKIHLQGLGLAWSMNDDGSENERYVLEKLQPSSNLKELSIRNYGGTRFPNWFFGDNYLSNIVSINLSNCKYCFSLPPLGILPSLKLLWVIGLERIEAIGPEFYGNNSSGAPFGSLQVLQFQKMDAWEEWDCQNALGAFPCLEELHVRDCCRLKNQLPEHLPSLLKLEIMNCEELAAFLPCAPAIHELVLSDCGKPQWESLAIILKVLRIGRMERSLLEKTMHIISNTCLETLVFSDCPNVEFPICDPLNFLGRLELRNSCDTLKALPLDLFPKLQALVLVDCSNIERFSISDRLDRSITSLIKLTITGCPKFVSFPEGMHTLFQSLTKLILMGCPQLEWPEGGMPSSLESLWIFDCPTLVASQMKWDLHSCTSLSELHIEDENRNQVDFKGSLPENVKTFVYNAPWHSSSLGYCSVLRFNGSSS